LHTNLGFSILIAFFKGPYIIFVTKFVILEL